MTQVTLYLNAADVLLACVTDALRAIHLPIFGENGGPLALRLPFAFCTQFCDAGAHPDSSCTVQTNETRVILCVLLLLKLAHLVELDQLGKALMLCSRLQMNPRLIGLKAERLGKTNASAVASAPNQLASVAAN